MHFILIPGLWLDGSSWDGVVPALEQAGHTTNALTLPGMESKTAVRSAITLRDHVDAVVKAIDAVDVTDCKVVVVGHSAGSGVAHAAVDARPNRVARAIYVSGFPIPDGGSDPGGYQSANGDIPFPDWSDFSDEDLADLDEVARAALRARAIPSPEHVTRDQQRLSDSRRYDVPVTAIATEYTSEMLREWIADGETPVQEFTKIRDVDYVDLPTGHWPQFTRPDDLARVILASVIGSAPGEPVSPAETAPAIVSPTADLDEHGRPEPPLAADETGTLLGFLEYQRATVAWKCTGLDAAGLKATVGASSIRLGGMLKHLAGVEDYWFSRRLHGRDAAPPWDTADWDADPDWDWHPAPGDTPEQLLAFWQGAVACSRSLVAEALADGGLDRLARRPRPNGESPSLRWIVVHMIEEYARHNGHADLIRESVDGLTGE